MVIAICVMIVTIESGETNWTLNELRLQYGDNG